MHLGYREYRIVEQTIYDAFASNSAVSEIYQREEFLSSASHQLLFKSGYGVDFLFIQKCTGFLTPRQRIS
jgi:hypothetical protein